MDVKRKIPGKTIVKASSYEHDKLGNTTEDSGLTAQGVKRRIDKYKEISKESNKLKVIKN